MPLHIADPLYLSFEERVLPRAAERGMGIQGMKNFANAKLMQNFSARECLTYVLSLPIHCTAIGCTTVGQLEDDVRIAKEFKPFSEGQMVALRERERLARDLHDHRVPAALAPGRPDGEWTRLPITRLRCTRPPGPGRLTGEIVTCASPSDELGPSPGMGGLLREIDRDPRGTASRGTVDQIFAAIQQ
jgi:hypothetical protein